MEKNERTAIDVLDVLSAKPSLMKINVRPEWGGRRGFRSSPYPLSWGRCISAGGMPYGLAVSRVLSVRKNGSRRPTSHRKKQKSRAAIPE